MLDGSSNAKQGLSYVRNDGKSLVNFSSEGLYNNSLQPELKFEYCVSKIEHARAIGEKLSLPQFRPVLKIKLDFSTGWLEVEHWPVDEEEEVFHYPGLDALDQLLDCQLRLLPFIGAIFDKLAAAEGVYYDMSLFEDPSDQWSFKVKLDFIPAADIYLPEAAPQAI